MRLQTVQSLIFSAANFQPVFKTVRSSFNDYIILLHITLYCGILGEVKKKKMYLFFLV